MNQDELLDLLKSELAPAVGCTEPVAVALTSAQAYKLVTGQLKRLKVEVSSNIYKNAKAVGIPGTDHTGTEFAAFLGTTIKEPKLDLSIFTGLSKTTFTEAVARQEAVPLELVIKYDKPSVYIDVFIETSSGVSRAITAGTHANLVYLSLDDEVLLQKEDWVNGAGYETPSVFTDIPLDTLIENVLAIPSTALEFLQEGVDLNLDIARKGQTMGCGLGIGLKWKGAISKGLLKDDITSKLAYFTSAAADARMAGMHLPVMSCTGSGNHGLVAFLPIAIVAQELQSPRERMLQALAVGLLVTIYIKTFTGRLTPVCGCGVAAGSGASAGLAHLLGGDTKVICDAIQNTISSLAGMICDGGKIGCSLKLCSSASMAWYCAILAVEGLTIPAGNGIVGGNPTETIKNFGRVSKKGMVEVDDIVISIMREQGSISS